MYNAKKEKETSQEYKKIHHQCRDWKGKSLSDETPPISSPAQAQENKSFHLRFDLFVTKFSDRNLTMALEGREAPIVEQTKRKYLVRLLPSLANDKEWYRILIESVMSDWVLLCLICVGWRWPACSRQHRSTSKA